MIASCPSLCCSCRKNPSQADKQKVGSRSCHLQELLEAGLGCQPFSCRCWQNLMRCRKEICWTCLFKESIPAIPFWEFQVHTFYQKQVPESGTARSTHSALRRLHHARHIVAAGKTCPMQRSRGFGHEVAGSKICDTAVIVLGS